jgi:hypothetical protein
MDHAQHRKKKRTSGTDTPLAPSRTSASWQYQQDTAAKNGSIIFASASFPVFQQLQVENFVTYNEASNQS